MPWTAICADNELDGETYETPIICLRDKLEHHSLEIEVSAGAGSVVITPYTSISGKSWKNEGEVVTGFGTGSGGDSDGIEIVDLLLSPAESIYFKVVATGAATITLWFAQK